MAKAAKKAAAAAPQVEDLPIPKGQKLADEVEEWRRIGQRWIDRHDDEADEMDADNTLPAEEPGRDGYTIVDATLRKVRSTDRRAVFVRATRRLIEQPPAKLADELLAFRRIARPALLWLEENDPGCDEYKEWIAEARELMGMPVPLKDMQFSICTDGIEMPRNFDPSELDWDRLEVIIQEKPAKGSRAQPKVIFQVGVESMEEI